jgi:hypothetical protein
VQTSRLVITRSLEGYRDKHRGIKKFDRTTSNAVNTQLWISLSVLVLVAIVKEELKVDKPLRTILPTLSITLFQYEPIYQTAHPS